jgi:hypothetical protein
MRRMRGNLVGIARALRTEFSGEACSERPRRVVLTTLVLVACLALVAPVLRQTQDVVLAQVSANYDLSWHVIAGGGGRMAGTQHTLQGTTGQAVVGPAAGSGHTLCSGFWCGVGAGYRVYLPLVLRNAP